jgi:D-cysteine desulfhydrase
MDIKVIGIVVCDSSQFFRAELDRLLSEFNERFHMQAQLGEYELFDQYIGPGYGQTYEVQRRWMRKLKDVEGVLLDPSYGGKAFCGMMEMISEGNFRSNDRVLFIHTGGIWGLVAEHTDIL